MGTIKNRRLIQGEDIIYPFTRQENIIGLQKTIKDKLPIVSDTQPAANNYVENQVWIQTSEGSQQAVIANDPEPNVVHLEPSFIANDISVGTELENETPHLENEEQRESAELEEENTGEEA